jgi:hypothetical protein
MATEYCAWPDGCTGYFNYQDEAERQAKLHNLKWQRYPEAPAHMGPDRHLCERHSMARVDRIWQETGAKGGKPKLP